jgi:hypothetical protein
MRMSAGFSANVKRTELVVSLVILSVLLFAATLLSAYLLFECTLRMLNERSMEACVRLHVAAVQSLHCCSAVYSTSYS